VLDLWGISGRSLGDVWGAKMPHSVGSQEALPPNSAPPQQHLQTPHSHNPGAASLDLVLFQPPAVFGASMVLRTRPPPRAFLRLGNRQQSPVGTVVCCPVIRTKVNHSCFVHPKHRSPPKTIQAHYRHSGCVVPPASSLYALQQTTGRRDHSHSTLL